MHCLGEMVCTGLAAEAYFAGEYVQLDVAVQGRPPEALADFGLRPRNAVMSASPWRFVHLVEEKRDKGSRKDDAVAAVEDVVDDVDVLVGANLLAQSDGRVVSLLFRLDGGHGEGQWRRSL